MPSQAWVDNSSTIAVPGPKLPQLSSEQMEMERHLRESIPWTQEKQDEFFKLVQQICGNVNKLIGKARPQGDNVRPMPANQIQREGIRHVRRLRTCMQEVADMKPARAAMKVYWYIGDPLFAIQAQAKDYGRPQDGDAADTRHFDTFQELSRALDRCLEYLMELPAPEIVTRIVLRFRHDQATLEGLEDFDTEFYTERNTSGSLLSGYPAEALQGDISPDELIGLSVNSVVEDIPEELKAFFASGRWAARFPKSLQKETSERFQCISDLLYGGQDDTGVKFIWNDVQNKLSQYDEAEKAGFISRFSEALKAIKTVPSLNAESLSKFSVQNSDTGLSREPSTDSRPPSMPLSTLMSKL